ncbi:MAG: toll/interleukin-1 receptor domain-containing protein [Anaerolineae bacterium]|nr:toll/interleukin-1 receptor domain-containing protein [Anaerolineae bacterium]
MPSIFVSYSSQDRDRVTTLVEDIRGLGHEVWFDQHITGGQVWWDNILLNIRQSKLVIVAVTPKLLRSEACRLEYTYANDVKRHIIPVLLDQSIQMTMLPVLLQERQVVNYSAFDKAALLALNAAIARDNESPALPEPLPDPPPVPISPIARLRDQISAPTISAETQTYVLHQLKLYLDDAEYGVEARATLEQFSQHPSLLAIIFREINEIVRQPGAAPAPAPEPTVETPLPPPPPKATAKKTQSKTSAKPAKSADTGTGTLVITRPNAVDGGSAIHIFVDGNKVGEIKGGEKKEFPLMVGVHEVYFSFIDKSEVFPLTAVAGQKIVFEVKFKWFFGTDVVVSQLSS